MNEVPNHEKNCACDYCTKGMAEMEKREAEWLQKAGWYAHFIVDDTHHPYRTNVHTHGLAENFNHPDLQICLNMPPKTSHDILITCVEDYIKKGKRFEAGKKYDGLITASEKYAGHKYEVLFLAAVETGRPVLRLIFPDREGRFDGTLKRQFDGCTLPENIN